MTLTLKTPAGSLAVDLERISAALEPAGPTPYAPPYVYPLAAPKYVKEPEAARPWRRGGAVCLYAHIPYCNYACSFCTYAKKVTDDRAEMTRYVEALRRELEFFEGVRLTQLLVGGGTPTALPADLLDRVLASVFAHVERKKESIHTVECSPESLTPEHLRVLIDHGIGRISMGIQSLDDAVLARINRHHSGAAALAVCDRLVASGRIVNVDLIYGLPGQTEEMLQRDFEALTARGVHSVCAYSLRVNEATPILQFLPAEERLDLARLMRWRAALEVIAADVGLERVSGQVFARPGLVFKNFAFVEDQLGVGLSARTRLNEVVYRNHASPSVYLERIEGGRSPVEEVFRFTEQDRKTRYIALSLEFKNMLDLQAYEDEFACSFDDEYGESVDHLREADLIADRDGKISVTPTGRLICDRVALAFYPRHLQEWLGERHAAAVARWHG